MKHRNKMLPLIALAWVISTISTISATAQNQINRLFLMKTDTIAGVELNYRVAGMTDTCGIVVLYLHGGSGRGTDNRSQMSAPAIMDIHNFLTDNGQCFTMLIPQAPYNTEWTGPMVSALKGLLDQYSLGGRRKVYVLGGSMGGNGTWNLLTAYPGYITAAMPVACNTPKGKPARYAATRICSVAGGDDRRRKIDAMQTFFTDFTEAGGDGRLDIENSWNHRVTCDRSFTPARLSYLFGI